MGWIEEQCPISTYPWPLIEYYRTGAASGYKGAHYSCDKDSFDIPLNPVRGVYWLKKAASLGDADAVGQLEPFQSLINDDNRLSYAMAKKDVEEMDEELRKMACYVGLPYAALAWHYFYGIGCEKNLNEAKRLIRLACNDDGSYSYRSYKKLIKDMGLESELIFVNDNN